VRVLDFRLFLSKWTYTYEWKQGGEDQCGRDMIVAESMSKAFGAVRKATWHCLTCFSARVSGEHGDENMIAHPTTIFGGRKETLFLK